MPSPPQIPQQRTERLGRHRGPVTGRAAGRAEALRDLRRQSRHPMRQEYGGSRLLPSQQEKVAIGRVGSNGGLEKTPDVQCVLAVAACGSKDLVVRTDYDRNLDRE